MRQSVSKRDFEFIQVSDECKENFVSKDSHELADVEAWVLRLVGNAIRQQNSQWYWSCGAYCWYTDQMQNHRQCVYLTKNNCLMFEDIEKGELYRVRDIIR